MRARARGRGPLASLVAGLFLSLGSLGSLDRASFAQVVDSGAPSSPGASTRTLDVTLIDGGDDAGLLMDTIRELVRRLGLGLVPHTVTAGVSAGDASADAGTSPPAGLAVSVDLASRHEVVVIVRNGPIEVRRTIPRDASPAIVREEISEAVRSAVESQLLADETPRPPTPAPPASPPPVAPIVVTESPSPSPSPSPSSSRGLAVDLTTLAGAGGIADGAGPVAHVGGGFVVGSRHKWRPSVSVTGEYVVGFDTSYSTVTPVTSHASLVSLRAMPALEVVHGSWIALDVGAGAGVDIIAVTAVLSGAASASPTIRLNPDVATKVDPVLTARATAYVALAPGVALTVVVGGDVDLASRHYFIDDGAQDPEVFVPWRVRPVVLAGFTFTAAGSGLFAARVP
jgi:hypothetical protein